eukprot:8389561-Lingulodinium_polyedra.AAC.1
MPRSATRHAKPCHATPRVATQRHAMPRHAVPRSAAQCHDDVQMHTQRPCKFNAFANAMQHKAMQMQCAFKC